MSHSRMELKLHKYSKIPLEVNERKKKNRQTTEIVVLSNKIEVGIKY